MAKYIYPAVFIPEKEGGYSVGFPDVEGCFTSGDTLEDALAMAKDALSLMLVELEDEEKAIPDASDIRDLKLEKKMFAIPISADTMDYRENVLNATKPSR